MLRIGIYNSKKEHLFELEGNATRASVAMNTVMSKDVLTEQDETIMYLTAMRKEELPVQNSGKTPLVCISV